jgi:ABC-type spermidine/putrescine transport system permease subunit II
MNLSKSARWGLTAITGIVLVFIYFPLLVVLVNGSLIPLDAT